MQQQYEALYREYVREIQGVDLQQLYLQFLGNMLDLKTVCASQFERSYTFPNEAVWGEASAWVVFVETIKDDWETREKIDPIQSLVGLTPKCFGTTGNVTIAPTNAETLREFFVTSNLQRVARIELEAEVPKHDANKHCQLEVIRHVQPKFFLLVLACAAKRMSLIDNDKLSDNYKLNFSEVQLKYGQTISEKFEIEFLKVGVLKQHLQQNSRFQANLQAVRFNNDSEMLDRVMKNNVESLDLWSVAIARFRVNGIEKEQKASKDPDVKCFKIWFSQRATGKTNQILSKELVLYFEYRQTSKTSKPKSNNVAALMLLDIYFPECARLFLKKLISRQFAFTKEDPINASSPKISATESRFWSEPESNSTFERTTNNRKPEAISMVSVPKLFSTTFSEYFEIKTVSSSSEDAGYLVQRLEDVDFPQELSFSNLWWQAPSIRTNLIISANRIGENEEILHSSSDNLTRVILSFTDDSKDQKIFFKDIKVTRLQPDPSLNWDQELQLKTNIAVFFALEGWCDSLQQLIALKLSKSLLVEAVQRQISEPQPKVGVSPQLSTVRPRTYDEADFENGIFKTAMVTGLQPRKIVVEDAVNSLRKYLGEDQHLKEVASAIFTKLIEETTYKSKSQLLNFDEALEKYLRQSTEKEFDFILAEEQSTQVNLQVIDQNTKQLFWSAVLIKPADWSEDRLNKGYRRFKNLLSCRLLKKNNFEPIALIEGIRNVD